jgi:hypothetical protein
VIFLRAEVPRKAELPVAAYLSQSRDDGMGRGVAKRRNCNSRKHLRGISGAIGDGRRIPRYLDWHRYWEADFCNKAFKFQRKWRFRIGQFDPNDCGF